MLGHEGRLHDQCGLHRAQSTTHPLLGGGAIAFVPWPEGGGGKDIIVDVGEGPNSGIGSRSSGNGTELVT